MLGPMKRLSLVVAAVMTWIVAGGSVLRAEEAKSVDIVVYGGTSSGIIAAVRARHMGKSVVLIEPSKHLGGLTTGGLGATDIGNKAAIGGLARIFHHLVWQHYQKDDAWKQETRREYADRSLRKETDYQTMWTFE